MNILIIEINEGIKQERNGHAHKQEIWTYTLRKNYKRKKKKRTYTLRNCLFVGWLLNDPATC